METKNVSYRTCRVKMKETFYALSLTDFDMVQRKGTLSCHLVIRELFDLFWSHLTLGAVLVRRSMGRRTQWSCYVVLHFSTCFKRGHSFKWRKFPFWLFIIMTGALSIRHTECWSRSRTLDFLNISILGTSSSPLPVWMFWIAIDKACNVVQSLVTAVLTLRLYTRCMITARWT
jgi:hypothetical protein